jgi:aspartate kinase
MSRIVVKFGGTSVADVARIEEAAAKVAAESARGNQVVVVVSAMAGVTNELVGYCNAIDPMHDPREYDSVVSSGEQITAGLMAIALRKRGVVSRSWQGWQVPISCDAMHSKARIVDIRPSRLVETLSAGEVPVVAGFQGISEESGRVTTLGRGGSDTTAVALAAALKADRCDIYTDVDGVYTTDPRIVPTARKLPKVSYEEMLEMAALGAKVLHPRSVELAMAWNVPVQVLSSFESQIGSDFPGTLVTKEDDIVEKQIVNGVTYTRGEAKITLIAVPDMPGVAAGILGPLAEAGISVDMIVQNISADGKTTDMTFTVARTDLPRAVEVLKKNAAAQRNRNPHGKQRSKSFGGGDWDEFSCRGGANHVQNPCRQRDQYSSHHDVRNQDQRFDRRRLYRTCRSGASCGVRSRFCDSLILCPMTKRQEDLPPYHVEPASDALPEDFYTELSVGEILRRARIAHNLNHAQVEQALRIKISYLEAMENDSLDALPGRVYTFGFVRTYAEFLGLDGEKMAELLRRKSGAKVAPRPVLAVTMEEEDRRMPSWQIVGGSTLLLFIVLAVIAALSPDGGDESVKAVPFRSGGFNGAA